MIKQGLFLCLIFSGFIHGSESNNYSIPRMIQDIARVKKSTPEKQQKKLKKLQDFVTKTMNDPITTLPQKEQRIKKGLACEIYATILIERTPSTENPDDQDLARERLSVFILRALTKAVRFQPENPENNQLTPAQSTPEEF